MGKKKELTSAERGTIFYCRKRGDSYRTIAKTVGCSLATVCKTLKRHAKTGSFDSKARSGRPPLFRTKECKKLERLVTCRNAQNRRLCTEGIQQIWRKKTKKRVSACTIGRVLRSM